MKSGAAGGVGLVVVAGAGVTILSVEHSSKNAGPEGVRKRSQGGPEKVRGGARGSPGRARSGTEGCGARAAGAMGCVVWSPPVHGGHVKILFGSVSREY